LYAEPGDSPVPVVVGGAPTFVHSGAARAGVVNLTRSLAAYWARHDVTINALAPGYVETDMTANLEPAQKQAMLAGVPLGRAASAGEVAAAVLFLASEEAAYITGQVLAVNGGMYM